MSWIRETIFIFQNESCECKCRLNGSVCNSKQKFNCDDYRGDWKEFDDLGSCKKGYIWALSTYDCEWNEACEIDQYLENWKCLCGKLLIGKRLIEYEDETLNTTETLLDKKKETCELSYLHISLIIICTLLLIIISIGCYYHYTRYLPKQNNILTKPTITILVLK